MTSHTWAFFKTVVEEPTVLFSGIIVTIGRLARLAIALLALTRRNRQPKDDEQPGPIGYRCCHRRQKQNVPFFPSLNPPFSCSLPAPWLAWAGLFVLFRGSSSEIRNAVHLTSLPRTVKMSSLSVYCTVRCKSGPTYQAGRYERMSRAHPTHHSNLASCHVLTSFAATGEPSG